MTRSGPSADGPALRPSRAGSRAAASIGILGGTFDPVHHGHLRLAVEVAERLGLARVHLVPAGSPPHRDAPRASADVRRRMLAAALTGVPGIGLDERELRREGPSYMIDTLAAVRREHPAAPLWLLLGMDAFAALDTWHRWRELLDVAHIAVARRPGAAAPAHGAIAELLRAHRVALPPGEPAARGRPFTDPAGCVAVIDIPRLEISASAIRGLIGCGRSPRFLLPSAVLAIIEQEELYTDAEP